MNTMTLENKQKDICKRFSASYQECDLQLKVGISLNVKNGLRPLNGLRIKAENGTSGWYIWAGEWSNDPNFFAPLHAEHLTEWADIVLPYLGLPTGWRFLITQEYEDVWQDPALLNN
jgi:hypothetical protein